MKRTESFKVHLPWIFICCLILLISITKLPIPVKGQELGENLLINPGFEELEEDIPVSWVAKGGWGSSAVVPSTEFFRTGSKSIQMVTETTTDLD